MIKYDKDCKKCNGTGCTCGTQKNSSKLCTGCTCGESVSYRVKKWKEFVKETIDSHRWRRDFFNE
jgi:hypothetical protein